jgi:hypothetical protein
MILDRLMDAVAVPRVAHDGLLARAEAADRGGLVGRARLDPAAEPFAAAPFAAGQRSQADEPLAAIDRADGKRSA